WQRQVRLDLVAVAAAVLLLHEVPGLSQISDDAVGAALGDAHPGSDVAQSHAGVVGDAQQHPGVVGQEAPVCHAHTLSQTISGSLLLVSACERSVKIALRAGLVFAVLVPPSW